MRSASGKYMLAQEKVYFGIVFLLEQELVQDLDALNELSRLEVQGCLLGERGCDGQNRVVFGAGGAVAIRSSGSRRGR